MRTFPLASLISLFSSFRIQGRSAHLKAQFTPQPKLKGDLPPLSPSPLSARQGFFFFLESRILARQLDYGNTSAGISPRAGSHSPAGEDVRNDALHKGSALAEDRNDKSAFAERT